MKSLIRELIGGAVLMIVAALVGIAFNAVRPGGIPLIMTGAPVATTAHGDTSGTAAQLPEGAVSVEQVKAAFDDGSAVIIDARDAAEYEAGHIPGAINIPYDRLPEFMETLNSEVPMDANVIIYCRGPLCDFSDTLATELKVIGYQTVSVFTGGWEHWIAAKHPTETGPR